LDWFKLAGLTHFEVTLIISSLLLLQLMPSKGIELEKEMLEAEYSFVVDKIARLQEKVLLITVPPHYPLPTQYLCLFCVSYSAQMRE